MKHKKKPVVFWLKEALNFQKLCGLVIIKTVEIFGNIKPSTE